MNTLEKLLKALRAEGYKNENPDAASVKSFMAENNLSIADADGNPVDVDALFKTKAAKSRKLTLDDEPKEEPVDDDKSVVELAREMVKSMHSAARGGGGIGTPDAGRSTTFQGLEAKSYNARAAAGKTAFPDADIAEFAGAYFRLAMTADGRHKSYPQLKRDREIVAKANVTSDFSSGGFSVPEALQRELINIRTRVGAIDTLLPAKPIPASGVSVPRRTAGVTVYSITEAPTTAITDSAATGDQVKLTPFNVSGLVYASNRWLSATAIDAGDLISGELAYAMKSKLENIWINGDGSSTYFNQQGLLGRYSSIVTAAGGTWTTDAEYAAGCVRAAGGTWASVTEANIIDMMGAVGDLEGADIGGMAFLCSWQFYCSVFKRLMMAKGGVTMAETANGLRVPTYDGHPIIFSSHMPTRSAVSTVSCYFGAFNLGCKHGVVPELMVLESNPNVGWTTNKMAFKISEEHALAVHDIGNANATAASRTPGPVSFLITTA